MNDQAVLYALSTLAQTCAALAAFVGAVGLFRLQILRDQRRETEFELRAQVQNLTSHADMMRLTITDIQSWLTEKAPHSNAAETNRRLLTFPHRQQTAARVLAGFESWNLFVILLSLVGFAHIPTPVCWRWTSEGLWLVSILTVLVTGASLFVWLELGTTTLLGWRSRRSSRN